MSILYFSRRADRWRLIVMKEPLVSVVISTYNEEKYILDSINSILHQTYENIEIII